MFDNIGGKIKAVAQILCWIGFIITGIYGLIAIFTGSIWRGLLIIVIGSSSSWLGSFFTYGFGQLIENSDRIAQALNDSQAQPIGSHSAAQTSHNDEWIPKNGWKCGKCGTINPSSRDTCKSCGTII